MDDVVLVTDLPKADDHHRGDHRGCDLEQGGGAHDTRLLTKDNITHVAIVCSTEHITRIATLGEALGEDLHHTLDPAFDRVKLT